MFRAGRGLPDPNTLKMGAGDSPLVTVYQAGYRELEAQLGAADHRPKIGRDPLERRRRGERGLEGLPAGDQIAPILEIGAFQ